MPKGELRVVRPLPGTKQLHRQIRRRMEYHLGTLAKRSAFHRQVLVRDWQRGHMPLFRGEVETNRDTVEIQILILNNDQRINDYSPATVEDLWRWWSETGTKRHIIRPVRADHLRFVIDNRVIFTKMVRHPGTRPNTEAKRAIRKSNATLSGSVSTYLKESVKEGMWDKK